MKPTAIIILVIIPVFILTWNFSLTKATGTNNRNRFDSTSIDFEPAASFPSDGQDGHHSRSGRVRMKTQQLDDFSKEDSNVSGQEEDYCPPQFGKRCVCRTVIEGDKMNRVHGRSKFVVNCTGTVFTNASVLSYLPDYTDELIFVGNKLPNLPPNLFGKNKEYPNLKKIDLSENDIETIDGKAFHHVSKVEKLILNHNNLSNDTLRAHPRVFSNFYNLKELYLTNAFNDRVWNLADLAEIFLESNLTQLVKIHLEQNELELINNPYLFCPLPSLTQIYLAQNLLPDINLNISCLDNLQVLDLRHNDIKRINDESSVQELLNRTNGKGEPIRVELLGNPLICDCELQSFIYWLRNATLKDTDLVRDLEKLECKSGLPETNKGLNVKAVEITTCPPALKSVSNYSAGLASVVSWILIIIVIIVVIGIIYLNHTCIYRCIRVRPCLGAGLSSSSGYSAYTSIDKTEECEVAHV